MNEHDYGKINVSYENQKQDDLLEYQWKKEYPNVWF